MFQRLPFAFNVSISLFFSSEPGPFCVSCFLYMSALLLTSAPSFLCQPCPFRFKFQPCPFVSTLSFCFQLFPCSFQPRSFRFNPALSFQPCPFCLKASLHRCSPVLWSQLVLFVSNSFLYPISFPFDPFLLVSICFAWFHGRDSVLKRSDKRKR